MKQKKQKKARTKTYWKKKADNLWSEIIRERVCRCEVCGRPGQFTKQGKQIKGLNAHHLILRGNLLWRHDLRNGVCLCVYCHKWSPVCCPHGGSIDSTIGFVDFMKDNKPEQWAWYEHHKDIRKTPELTMEETYNYLKELQNTGEVLPYSERVNKD